MAKVVHKNNNTNDIFDGVAALKISGDRHTATYEDGLTQGKLVFVGSNLTREPGTDYLSGGTIRKVLITDENNQFALKLTGASISADKLPHNYTSGDLHEMLGEILSGRDTIMGGTYNDYLYGYGGRDRLYGKVGNDDLTGGAGNDILRGGAGSDVFHFYPADEGRSHDVIKDFDVIGNKSQVDYLDIKGSYTPVPVHGGHDTRLDIYNGSTILLEDVKLQELQSYWQMLNS